MGYDGWRGEFAEFWDDEHGRGAEAEESGDEGEGPTRLEKFHAETSVIWRAYREVMRSPMANSSARALAV